MVHTADRLRKIIKGPKKKIEYIKLIEGPEGKQGLQGKQGPEGKQGSIGKQGQGKQGLQGEPGVAVRVVQTESEADSERLYQNGESITNQRITLQHESIVFISASEHARRGDTDREQILRLEVDDDLKAESNVRLVGQARIQDKETVHVSWTGALSDGLHLIRTSSSGPGSQFWIDGQARIITLIFE